LKKKIFVVRSCPRCPILARFTVRYRIQIWILMDKKFLFRADLDPCVLKYAKKQKQVYQNMLLHICREHLISGQIWPPDSDRDLLKKDGSGFKIKLFLYRIQIKILSFIFCSFVPGKRSCFSKLWSALLLFEEELGKSNALPNFKYFSQGTSWTQNKCVHFLKLF